MPAREGLLTAGPRVILYPVDECVRTIIYASTKHHRRTSVRSPERVVWPWNGLLVLLVTGCIVSIVGFALAQYLPALIIVALIVIAFLYSDFQESHKSGRRDLKKNAVVTVFVIVTAYCMITGLWIFWAGITLSSMLIPLLTR